MEDLNRREYVFYFNDRNMKTSYEEAEKACQKSRRQPAQVANFNTYFITNYGTGMKHLFVYDYNHSMKHHNRKVYVESVDNLR